MANATKKTVTKEVTVEKEEKQVVLTLSEEEAKMVMAAMNSVGGSSMTTKRDLSNSVASALHSAGVYYNNVRNYITAGSIFAAAK